MFAREPAKPIWKDWTIVREFLSALADPQTYSLGRNGYVFFGILWGLPVPVVTIGVDLYAQHLAPTPRQIVLLLLAHPFQFFFLLHPFFFAVLFGAMGTVRYRKEQRIRALLEDLRAKVADLEKLNEKLREADRLKDEFLGTISHELKTPLVTVRGYAEMLLRRRAGALDERQVRILKVVMKNVERQIHLIDDLLNYIRIGAHPGEGEREEFDLRDTIALMRQTFAPSLEEKSLHFETILPDAPLVVYANRSNVEIVLCNLISNAIKFTDPGGRIRVEARDTGAGKILVWVEDTGCGIPEESLPHIFERFRQADGSMRRRHGGTGLGLAIVKKILDNYGCSIEVTRSKIGEGTTFCFDLPAAPGRAASAAAVTAGVYGEGRNQDGGGEQADSDY